MKDFHQWWARQPARDQAIYTVALWALIFVAGIDIGRAIYQATH